MMDSPCVRRCCLDTQDCCLGCGRLYQEILEWHDADPARKEQICQLAAGRLQQPQRPLFMHPGASLSE